jgi:predicted secreted protein
MNIIQDTIAGALMLSVFDFIACFFVLYFIGFFIKILPLLNRNKKDDKRV